MPVCYFSMGGWFYGITLGLNTKNVFLWRNQFRLAEQEYFARSFARNTRAAAGGGEDSQSENAAATPLWRRHHSPFAGVPAHAVHLPKAPEL